MIQKCQSRTCAFVDTAFPPPPFCTQETVEAIGSSVVAIRGIVKRTIDSLVGGPHESAVHNFNKEVEIVLGLSNMEHTISALGTARMRGNSCSKESDGQWKPYINPPAWPSVVMEVGVSESFNKLKADAAWWLENSRGQVRLVILISIDRTSPKIRYQTMVLNPETPDATK
ncbi:hypothetical protein N7486_002688 [Penicillium sp. IBT 16267x]|nr:hypothetical protein N7486_002688 [Penicillium sp. IBT 16267x]